MGNSNKNNNDTTAHLLKWPKPRTLTIPNAEEYVDQQKLLFIADVNTECYSNLRRQFADFLLS